MDLLKKIENFIETRKSYEYIRHEKMIELFDKDYEKFIMPKEHTTSIRIFFVNKGRLYYCYSTCVGDYETKDREYLLKWIDTVDEKTVKKLEKDREKAKISFNLFLNNNDKWSKKRLPEIIKQIEFYDRILNLPEIRLRKLFKITKINI